jgi:hypothetical protein
MPRMHGLPPHVPGSAVMRSNAPFSLIRIQSGPFALGYKELENAVTPYAQARSMVRQDVPRGTEHPLPGGAHWGLEDLLYFEPRSSPSFIPLLLRPVLPGGLQARSKHLAAAPCATTTSGSSGGSSASCYTCAAVRSPAGEWFFRPPPKPQIGAATDVLDADAIAAAGAARLLIDGPVF